MYNTDEELRGVIDLIRDGAFSNGDRELFRPLVDNLLLRDPYLVLAGFRSYLDCQDRVGALYRDQALWTRMSILNCARSGKFSSDRSIREYCRDVWNTQPVPVQMLSPNSVKAEFLQ